MWMQNQHVTEKGMGGREKGEKEIKTTTKTNTKYINKQCKFGRDVK